MKKLINDIVKKKKKNKNGSVWYTRLNGKGVDHQECYTV